MRRALIAAAVLLAGGEAFLRVRLGPPADESAWSDSQRYLGEESRRPFFAASPAPGGGTLWSPARPRSTAKPFVEPKPAGLTRVFVAGESVAQLLPAGALEAAFGGKNVEVINCGMGAYDAGRVERVVRDALERGADRLVVLAGNNDGAPDGGLPGPLLRVNAALRRSRLWRSVQDALHSAPRPTRAELDARFEKALRGIASAARARNVPLTLCTLSVNERDWPPSGELPLDAPSFFAAWRAWDAGQADKAAALFDKFVSERPSDPMGRYWLARALEKTGHAREAAAEYGKAVDLDWPARCTRGRNELIRRIAREEKSTLADLDAWARGRSKNGVSGAELFDDGVHWKPAFDAPVAAIIAGTPARPAAPLRGGDPSLRAISDALQASLEYDPPILSEQVLAEFRSARADDAAALARRLSDSPAVEAELAADAWTAFHAGRVAAHWTSVRLHAAEARWRDGDRRGALADFRAAAASDPGSALARLLTAKAELGLGMKKQAEADLSAIPEGSRESVLAALYLAEVR